MSNPRVFNAHPRAGGLLGGDGLFGDPFSDLPGLGGLSTALSPILTPIGLPGPKSTKTTAITSATTTSLPAITLTTSDTSSSATSASATSASTSDTTSATSSATSATSSSTTDSASSTSAAQSATSSATDATPTSVPIDTATVVLPASSSSSSTSAAPSSTAETAVAPKSFLQNKALSVGVITAASLVGLVLIIAIATWAIRKRRNERIHRDILDFSTANLVSDAEKGSGAGGLGGVEAASSTGHGSSSSHGALSQPPMQSRGMYDTYAAPSTYAAQPAQARAAYPAQPTYAYPFPSQEQNNTYANWGYGYGNAGAVQQPQNQFDQAYSGMDDAYGGLAYDAPQQPGAMAGVGAGAQAQGPQRRPSAHRKPPPALYIPPPNPIAETIATNAPSPISSVSLTKPPLQPAAGTGAAQPARRTSLLNSPAMAPEAPRERKDTLTHVEMLDPAAPKVPAASPRLPDEFGANSPPASKDAPVEQPVRRLVVRNE